MAKILVNDGIHAAGKEKLEAHGFELEMNKVEQDNLKQELPAYDAILVRSATTVRQELIDLCPNLKLIGRGGVGLDNIDVDYAKSKGINVINTPAASSRSVAELALGQMICLSRSLHMANQEMPLRGNSDFKKLKKACAKGVELKGRKLGIIGFGRIGQALGSLALAMGMEVLPVDRTIKTFELSLDIPHLSDNKISVQSVAMDEMLAEADFISLHLPSQPKAVLGFEEMKKMKEGVILINTSRGGLIDENDLLKAIDDGYVGGAALDVFVGEPSPNPALLTHSKISSSPHIGGSTSAAQRNIGLELADQIIEHFKN